MSSPGARQRRRRQQYQAPRARSEVLIAVGAGVGIVALTALMIWLFFLLALARGGGLDGFRWGVVWGLAALGASYVAATSVNDVADRDIDTVNHPADRGRPLVTGEATERDLRRLHVGSAGLALAASALAGWKRSP